MNNKTKVLICLLIFAFIPLGFILINNQTHVANAPEASWSRTITGTAKIVLDDTSNFYNSSTFNTSTTYKTDAGASISLDGAGAFIHLHGTCDTTHPSSYQLWISLSDTRTSQTSSKHIDWLNSYNTKYQYCYKKSSSYYTGKANYTEFSESASTFDSCKSSSFTKKSYNTGTDTNTNATFTYTVTPNSYFITIKYYKNGSRINTRYYAKRYRTTFDITYDDVTGYHVAGVYNNSSGSTKLFNANEKLICSGSNTYYAIYQPNTYTIVYHGNGNTGGSTAPSSHTYDTAKALTSNGFTKTGYRFIGWSTSENGSVVYSDGQNVKNLTATNGGTVNLYAQWAPITYSVAFDANGGDGGSMSPQSFTYDESQNLTKNSFTRTGHAFAGWNTNKNGTGTPYSDSASVSNLTTTNGGTVTLYAQWEAYVFTYSFETDGGSTHPGGTADYGSKIILPEPDKTGYTFKGWQHSIKGKIYQDGSYSVNDTANSDATVVFTAIWIANEYKINYNLPGDSHGSSHPTTAKYDSVVNISNPTKVGYTFTGWTASGLSDTAKSGVSNSLSALKTWNGSATKNTYFANLTATDNNTVTFTANWTANTYTIAFNGNDNTGGSTSPKKATYDSYVTLTANGFIKAGYVFTGWKESDGSGKSYTDKATVKNLTSVDGATVTLYAQWEETWANHASSSLKTTEINGVTYNVIASAEDLAYLSKQSISSTLLGKYIQTADIDLSDYTWLPIGSEHAFCGEYLGQGHKITGLHTSNAVDAKGVYLQTYGGLFGKLGKNATTNQGASIVGVYLSNKTDTTNTYTIYGKYTGGIAGLSNDKSVNIEACILENVEIYGNTTASFVGSSSAGQIKDCLLISSNISTTNTTTRGFYTGSMTVNSSYYMNGTTPTRFYTSGASSDYSNWVTGVFKYPLPKALIWYPGA